MFHDFLNSTKKSYYCNESAKLKLQTIVKILRQSGKNVIKSLFFASISNVDQLTYV